MLRPAGVDVLRICSDGRFGGQTFTGGHGGEAYRVAHWTGISVANIDAITPTLAELAHFMAPTAGLNYAAAK